MTTDGVCRADLIFKGRVVRQQMASLHREVRFEIQQIYHSGEGIDEPSYNLIATVTGSRAHCPCPEFEIGGTYIVFARYQDTWSRFVLTRHSTVRPYDFVSEFMIQYFLYQCRNLPDPTTAAIN